MCVKIEISDENNKTHISWFDMRWFGGLGREGRRKVQALPRAVSRRDQRTLARLPVRLGQGGLSLCWYWWVVGMVRPWDRLVGPWDRPWDGLVVSRDGLVVSWDGREVAIVVSSRSVDVVLEKRKNVQCDYLQKLQQ